MKLNFFVATVLVLGSSMSAWASPAERLAECRSDRDRDTAKLQKDERSWRKALDDKQDLLTSVKSGDPLREDYPALSAMCDCSPASSMGCTADFWKTQMGLSDEQIKKIDADPSRGCLKIYLKFGVNLQSVVPPGCYADIAGIPGDPGHVGCGVVNRIVLTKRLESEIAILQRKLDNDVPARKQRIADDYKDCVRSIDRYSSNVSGSTPGAASTNAKTIPSEDLGSGSDSATVPSTSAAAKK